MPRERDSDAAGDHRRPRHRSARVPVLRRLERRHIAAPADPLPEGVESL
jgi:hypothetical protein